MIEYKKKSFGEIKITINDDYTGLEKSDEQLCNELNILNCSVQLDRIGTSKSEISAKLDTYLRQQKMVNQNCIESVYNSKKYTIPGRTDSPGVGYLRCCNCKEWFMNASALARHTRQLIQCNICMNATRLPCAPGRGKPSAWNCEKPYFCTKIDLQLHFRGKHTKEYLRMVSALTGKPAGKSVQLGRHNHLKDDLDITANASEIRTNSKCILTAPLPLNHYSKLNKPGDLSVCNFRPGTFRGSHFKVHMPPQGGWRLPETQSKMPYASSSRQGRLKLDDVANQSLSTESDECTIEEIEENSTDVNQSDLNVNPIDTESDPIAVVKVESASGPMSGNASHVPYPQKLNDPENDEVPLTSLVGRNLIHALHEHEKATIVKEELSDTNTEAKKSNIMKVPKMIVPVSIVSENALLGKSIFAKCKSANIIPLKKVKVTVKK